MDSMSTLLFRAAAGSTERQGREQDELMGKVTKLQQKSRWAMGDGRWLEEIWSWFSHSFDVGQLSH